MKYFAYAILTMCLIAAANPILDTAAQSARQTVLKNQKPRAQFNGVVPRTVGRHASRKRKVNAGTVRIITDSIGSTHTRMAADMMAVFDKADELRILPILGRGAEQSITDILYLKGIDFGIVQSDVLQYIRDQGKFPDIQNRIHYITKLHNQEFHVIARKTVTSLADLEGKKVNFGIVGSGAHITATAVFKAHNLTVKKTTFDEINALDKLRLGEISAMVYVAGKPAPLLANIAADKNLHLIPVPYLATLKNYLPAKFEARDYPGLVAKGQTVPTIAVRAVLAVFNWRPGTPRYRKMVRFISTLFTKFHELRKPPRHPKWREVNIHAKVPGWNRYPPATEWVAKNDLLVAARRAKFRPDAGPEKKAFRKFVMRRGKIRGNGATSPRNMDAMFEQFMQWHKARARQARALR